MSANMDILPELKSNEKLTLGEWRANDALPHIDTWHEAFSITEEDSLFRPQGRTCGDLVISSKDKDINKARITRFVRYNDNRDNLHNPRLIFL